jgi:hypothetical protein
MQGSVRIGNATPWLPFDLTANPSAAITLAENGEPAMKFPIFLPLNT